jgi:hypothetical protein
MCKGVTIRSGIERTYNDSPFWMACEKGGYLAPFNSEGSLLVAPDMAGKLIDRFGSRDAELVVDITVQVDDYQSKMMQKVLTCLYVTKIVFPDGSSFKSNWGN